MTSPGSAAAPEAGVFTASAPMAADARSASHATALVYASLNRALSLCEQEGMSRYGIDTAMRLGCGLPAGPLELLDRIGLDSALAVLTELRARTGDDSFTPAPLLSRMVAQGRLGRKSGSGFCTGDESGRPVGTASPAAPAGQPAAVRRIAVLGSGTMARGIAEATSAAGFRTVLVARSEAGAATAVARIGDSLARGAQQGRIEAAARTRALEQLTGADDLRAVRDCDLVIEAVVEDLDVKRALFARLGAECRPETVLATTTSSLPVTACAEASGRPAQVVGAHFFNPAPVMKLVELVRTGETGDEAAAAVQDVCARLGKTAVHCPDRPGFIVNYLLFPYLGRALSLLEREDVSAEEIDTAIECGFGYPMGPFTLLDAIGLDVSLAIQRELHKAYGEPDFAPSRLLQQLVTDGRLGRKNRKGFRTADRATGPSDRTERPDRATGPSDRTERPD